MKKSLLALAALSAFAGAASAQSSVTLFGILDVNARSVDNGPAGTLKTEGTDGVNSSRLGLRGIEDLGGGLQAGFWIEGQMSPDVGGGLKATSAPQGTASTAQDWSRRSTVSLIGGFGEVRLGRDYVTTFNNMVTADIWNYVGVATVANVRNALGSNASTLVRASNQISYFLPTLGGIYGQISVAAGENTAGNKSAGLRFGYAAGPLNVGFAYNKTYKTSGNISTGATTSVANLATGAITTTTNQVTMLDDYKVANAIAIYDAGFAKFNLFYEKSTYALANQKVATASVVVPFGASSVLLSYTRSQGDLYNSKVVLVVDGLKDNEIGLGYQYDLSKRTALYAHYGRNANGAKANLTSSNGGNSVTGLAGFTSTGYEFGVRHAF